MFQFPCALRMSVFGFMKEIEMKTEGGIRGKRGERECVYEKKRVGGWRREIGTRI